MLSAEHVKKFSLLFRGYEKAHGRYRIDKLNHEKEKMEGQAKTVYTPVSYSIWEDHLLAKSGNGLGMIMLQENDTCRFAAIDVDDPGINHAKLVALIEQKGLPLVVCRSKSGGAHLYLFMKEDVPAVLVRAKLDEWRSVLGFSRKTEVFPKQVSRATPEETGNWINLPYYNAERTERFGFKGPQALDLGGFLEYATSRSVTLDQLKGWKLAVAQEVDKDDFFEGPPCLISIGEQGGFADGTRNNGMYSVGVYLKKRFPDTWKEHVDHYNQLMANLPSSEIQGTIMKGLAKDKNYNYKCKESPLADFCNRRLCLKREFGVGDAGVTSAEYEITNIVRLEYLPPDPPMWAFEVNGRRVLIENQDIYSVDAMNKACLAQANCIPLNVNMAVWRKILNKLIKSAEIVQMPSDASPTGQLWGRVMAFLVEGVPAQTKEEVFIGQVWRVDGIAYFRSVDLFQYFKQRGVRYQSEQYVWQMVKQHGGKTEMWNLKRGSGRVWFLPVGTHLDEVPRYEEPKFNSEDF